MRAPCRFCTAEGLNPTDHSEFKCPRKPPSGKRSTEPLAKKAKFHAMETVNALTRAEYTELATVIQQVQDCRTMITRGDIPAEEESPNQVLAITAGRASHPQQQLVPYVPSKAILTLTAVHDRESGLDGFEDGRWEEAGEVAGACAAFVGRWDFFVGAGGAVGEKVAGALDGSGVIAAGELEGEAFVVPLQMHTGKRMAAAELAGFESDHETAVGKGRIVPRIAHAIRAEPVGF